jgi:hypothetical protein
MPKSIQRLVRRPPHWSEWYWQLLKDLAASRGRSEPVEPIVYTVFDRGRFRHVWHGSHIAFYYYPRAEE